MGKSDVNTEDKAPSGAYIKGRGFIRRNMVWREAFVGTSEALNTVQVKFDCGEWNEWGQFSE